MFRKAICSLILIAMTLHCASRLGSLSFLYQNRHSIAYSLGLIVEVPITMCNSDYDFLKGVKIESSDDKPNIPWLTNAQEINLFFIPIVQQVWSQLIFFEKKAPLDGEDSYFLALVFSIFRPPTLVA